MTFLCSEKAASEVIGHILVLALTVIGISMIALVGVPAIYSLQDMTNARNAEQAFTVLDSRVSAVVLGGSPVQFIDLNLGGGTLTVEPNATGSESYIYIMHNATGHNDYLTVPMGKIRYKLGDRSVVYEGGGVWSKYPSGRSVMLSPPEFHYNGVTLTLPVINISGSGSEGGRGSAEVKLAKGPVVIMYPCGSNKNPVSSQGRGRVYVNITSEFYDAWADYAESLGYTAVREDEMNNSVNIELRVVPTTLGKSTELTTTIPFRGLDFSNDEPLLNLSFKIYGKPEGQEFLKWDIRAKSGDKTLIFYINKYDLTIGYQDDTYGPSAETWGTITYTPQTDSIGKYIEIDLLSKDLSLTYSNQIPVGSMSGVGGGSGCSKDNRIEGSIFNTTDFSWDNIIINTVNPNKTQSLYNITQHYFWKMAQEEDVSFIQCSAGAGEHSARIGSTMLINYTAVGDITYLHISDNWAEVDIV